MKTSVLAPFPVWVKGSGVSRRSIIGRVSSFDLLGGYKCCKVAVSPAPEIEGGTGFACPKCFDRHWQSRLDVLSLKQRYGDVEHGLVGGRDAAGSPGTKQSFVCGMGAGRTLGEPLNERGRLLD